MWIMCARSATNHVEPHVVGLRNHSDVVSCASAPRLFVGCVMNVEKLADELIALRCGTHSLGLVYEFLLKTYGDPKRARGDFVRFLSGELPRGLLEEAELWASEEQECDLSHQPAMLRSRRQARQLDPDGLFGIAVGSLPDFVGQPV
jgi:hypothetical protein